MTLNDINIIEFVSYKTIAVDALLGHFTMRYPVAFDLMLVCGSNDESYHFNSTFPATISPRTGATVEHGHDRTCNATRFLIKEQCL